MALRWPDFRFSHGRKSIVRWNGPLRGFQKQYEIEVLWDFEDKAKPYVLLRDPALRPIDGKPFAEIPHLLFYAEHPELSGLCLFDPQGGEWSNKLLIADTTIPWAGEWLFYYELWHVDGVWRGGGVGPENTAEARRASIYRASGELSQDPPRTSSMAI